MNSGIVEMRAPPVFCRSVRVWFYPSYWDSGARNVGFIAAGIVLYLWSKGHETEDGMRQVSAGWVRHDEVIVTKQVMGTKEMEMEGGNEISYISLGRL